MEDEHAEEDHEHEAVRRQCYAQRVLPSFWKEIRDLDQKIDKKEFRPKSLMPLLQRQRLAGVEENYGLALLDSISNKEGKTSKIEQATHFYLRDNPAHPRWIPNFGRNMIYTLEARCHLGIVLGAYTVGDVEWYQQVRENMDLLQGQAKEDDAFDCDTTDQKEIEYSDNEPILAESIPVLGKVEVEVIVKERLEDFLAPELERVVRIFHCRVFATTTTY